MTLLKNLIILSLINLNNGFVHTVPEGSVGIKIWNGRMMNYTYSPGRYVYTPILSYMSNINIRIQVDEINNVICTPSEGSKMIFKILVNNQLMEENVVDNIRRFGETYDKFLLEQPIIQKMTEWCTGKTFKQIYNTDWETLDSLIVERLKEYQIEQNTNLYINSVTVFKPQIDEKIQQSFNTATQEKSKREAEIETRKRSLEEATTRRQIEESTAEKEKKIAEIQNQILISNKRAEMKMNEIEEYSKAKQLVIKADGEKNSTLIRAQTEREALIISTKAKRDAAVFKAEGDRNVTKLLADAESYSNKVLAETEKMRFSKEFLQKHWQENVVKNGFYFGEKIPTYMANFPTTK